MSQFASLGTGGTAGYLAPFGLGFAPAGFGSIGGDLLVTDGASGTIYAVNSSGSVSVFANVAVPTLTGGAVAGLRQFAFAPAGFGNYGGDLFVSLSGSQYGGGTSGSVDVLNSSDALVAVLLQGAVGAPFDPRGLYFASNSQLLISDTDPSILSAPPSAFTATPEPSTMIPLALGFVAILVLSRRVRLKRAVWLAVFAAASIAFSGLAKADTCSGTGSTGPTCFFSNGVVYLYYGTLTLDSPNGTLISTTNIETAEGGLADFSSSTTILNATPPPGFVALFPSLVPQLESDPQTTFANIPTWAPTNLTNLADANGFGFVPDPTAMLNEPPDPAVVAFEAQLANVGGPFITTSDTGFQTQPFSLAYCEYVNALLGVTTPCVPGPPGTSQYEFTYRLGPYMNGGNT